MAAKGWRKLIPDGPCFMGEGNYPIDAYSEFLPPPRLGWKPYGTSPVDPDVFDDNDPHGWLVSEFEEDFELQPGLLQVGTQLLHKLQRLCDNDPHTTIPKFTLADNIYWPAELAADPKLPQEKFVLLLPLALSKTQDDKGRVRWTLFGGSEQGPGKAFWKGFFNGPKTEASADQGMAFFANLLQTVYGDKAEGEKAEGEKGLLVAGFRILVDNEPLYEHWRETPPSWTAPFIIDDQYPAAKVKYLLTFRPFGKLPAGIRKAYLDGKLNLLPFPGSLVFWGSTLYRKLQTELPTAQQIPLQMQVARHNMAGGFRVPQAGFFHEPNKERPDAGARAGQVKNTYRRSHRWQKVRRDEDDAAAIDSKDSKMIHVLFSTNADELELYNKPMARNAQLWYDDGRLLLDGPNADAGQIHAAMKATEHGGLYGYRFQFPAMRVGMHEVYWHRPLAAYRNSKGECAILPNAPPGYLTAYDAVKPKLDKALELWPRFQNRPLASATLAAKLDARHSHAVILNARKLLDAVARNGGKPLPRAFVKSLLTFTHNQTLDAWLQSLPAEVAAEVHPLIAAEEAPLARRGKVPASLTYAKTAKRSFELAYWNGIVSLAEGTFLNKNNSDCVLDEATSRTHPYPGRHLDAVADHLLAYHRSKVAAAGLQGKALVGDIPFRWETHYEYPWMDGWARNKDAPAERDLIVVIPGRDRSRTVIMSDHYDTAYMADVYYKELGGNGARMAACGADDNHSATVSLMLAAPILLDMSAKGLLECDIWLIHLTGEEFPADCLGARALTRRLVERSLKMRLENGKMKDLSKVKVKGLYVSDMIAHNHDHERDIYQVSPGTDPGSLWLARQAQIAGDIWNESVPVWNDTAERKGKSRSRRSPHGAAVPDVAPFPHLTGQVRQAFDPKSTLYNTDGLMFSDAGVPSVLFMENYDINRTGYHDTHDTMANIDLDYGAAFCAITIEAVARAATEEK